MSGLLTLDDLEDEPLFPPDVDVACRVCGCTEDDACVTEHGNCFWFEPDLCSACARVA